MRLFPKKFFLIPGSILRGRPIRIQRVSSVLAGFTLVVTVYGQNMKDTSVDIYFEINSFELRASERAKLENFASTHHSIHQITGFADSTGQEKSNVLLSRNRAVTVFDVLKETITSLNDTIVDYKGESEEMPAIWMNRRVRVTAYRNELNVSRKVPDHPADSLGSLFLDYLYFVPDKATLQPQSLDYIQDLARQLKTYSSETFDIVGHANYQSTHDSTKLKDIYLLSLNRAKLVYDYLIEYGIPARRMSYRGAGNSLPRYPHPVNDEERRKNMVVQIIIKK